jgi:hemerythrin-like domain-containing protein
MRATDVLRKEHDAILKMLDAAEELAARLERKHPVAPEQLDRLLEFFRLFADQCHHGKEEELLFPLLEKKGMPRQGGPIGVMLYEHDHGRALIAEMRESAQALAAGHAEAGARWAHAARRYVALLREHIYKENEILFRMAEQMLSEAEQADLVRQFEHVEVEKMGAGTHERLHCLMDELTAELFGAAAKHQTS